MRAARHDRYGGPEVVYVTDVQRPMLAWRRALRRGGRYTALGGSTAWLLSGLVQGPQPVARVEAVGPG